MTDEAQKSTNPIGRPSKYSPEMCDEVIAQGYLGKSKAQIARHLGINRDTLYAWCDTYPEFSDAVKEARDLAQAWWEDRGQAGINLGKDFNATAFIFQVKNRFRDDYNDSHSLQVEAKVAGVAKLPLAADEDSWEEAAAPSGASGEAETSAAESQKITTGTA